MSEDFEADNGGFTVSGTNPTWEWGAAVYGPGFAHSGTNVWATGLDGNYNDNEDSYITSPVIDLSSQAGKAVVVDWWQWLQTEGCCDYGEVQVSNNGGASWSSIFGPSYGDVDLSWNDYSVTLDPSYAVSNFQFRFHLYTDFSVIYPGYYVDDVGVRVGECLPMDGGLVVGVFTTPMS
jgi:bacillopeptidase F